MRKIRLHYLMLIMVQMLLLSACGSTYSQKARENSDALPIENVAFSNIRFYQDDLSEDERALMDRVVDMLKHAKYLPKTKEFIVSNSTGTKLDDIRFQFLFYDRDGTLINTYRLDLEDWPIGGQVEAILDSSFDSLDVASRFSYGNSYYQTLAEPISFTEEKEKVILHARDNTPFSVSLLGSSGNTQSFTISALRCESDTSSGENYLEILISKDSGYAADSVSMDYRIIHEEDRTVMISNLVTLSYLHEGEQFLYRSDLFELEPGNYLFEILG